MQYSSFSKSPTDLPHAYALHALSKGPLEDAAQLEGVRADLHQVVEERAHGGQRERGGEQRHVAELDEHLQVVLERAVVLEKEWWMVCCGAKQIQDLWN